MVKDYTIVVPTHNRSELLARFLQYLAACRVTCPVLVLDSSERAHAHRNRAVARRSALDITYLPSDPATPHAVKAVAGIQQVRTSCFTFCADDDVVFLGAVEACRAFLDDHPDYLAAHGYCLGFVEAGRRFELPAMLFAGPSIDQASPAARVYALMRHYEPIFYGVIRTEAWLRSMRRVFRVRDFLFREFLPACEIVAAGKVHRIRRPYSACRIDNAPAERTNPRTFTGNPVQWFLREPVEFITQYAAYRDAVVEALLEHGEPAARQADLQRGLDILHLGYLSSGIDHAMAGQHAAEALGLRGPLQPGEPGYIDPDGLAARGRSISAGLSSVTIGVRAGRRTKSFVLAPRLISYLQGHDGRPPALDRADLLSALADLTRY